MFSTQSEGARAWSPGAVTFANPIAPGADPWVIRHGGFYYWCLTEHDVGVAVYRSTTLTELGEKHVVWQAPLKGPHCAQIWAPELHHIEGRWYIYVAASDGRNEAHRMIVLEGAADDPREEFRFKAELYTGDEVRTGRNNRWAIDGTLLEHQGTRYFLWSGWEDERDEQWLYLAPMANPWTISESRVRIGANDDFNWERLSDSRRYGGLNEGPQVLRRNGRVFVVFSCSGSWEPTYKLGLLELAKGGNPRDPNAWIKYSEPVLEPTAKTFGVGHCSFTQSPDGTEDWIVYHAKVSKTHGWNRVVHAQPFTWEKGRPCFGPPAAAGVPMMRPSGDRPGLQRSINDVMRRLIDAVVVGGGTDKRGGRRLSA